MKRFTFTTWFQVNKNLGGNPTNIARDQYNGPVVINRAAIKTRVIVAAGVMLALTVTGVIYVPSMLESPTIEPVDLVVKESDGAITYELTYQNTGESQGVISDVVFTVADHATLPVCEGQGVIDISGEYDVDLPVEVSAGDQFAFPVSQELKADEADRIAIHTMIESGLQFNYYMYRLDIGLKVHGVEEPVNVGTAVAMYPKLPEKFQEKVYTGQDMTVFDHPDFAYPDERIAAIESCMQDNFLAMTELLDKPGERSTQLTALHEHGEVPCVPPSPCGEQ